MLARTSLQAVVSLAIVGSSSRAGGAPGVTASIAPSSPSRFGVMADVGLPDGAVASIVVRPFSQLRVHAGGGYNYVSPGVRGGVTLVPFSTWFTPTVSIDYGRYFDGDANPLARKVSGDPTYSTPVLDHVGYDYANAHVGLEFGRSRATFYIHAGMSRITGNIRGLQEMSSGSSSDSGTTVTFSDDPRVELWTVSARVGLVVYLVP